MQRAVRPAVSLALVLTCTLGTMLLGTALKSRCADGDWSDGRQYELLCYSDIVPLLGTEQLGGGRLPFLQRCVEVPGQNCDEYPVLTMYFMRTAGWFSGDSYAGFYFVNAALLLACAVITAVCLYVMVRGRALYFALAPTLLIYGTMNWDLFAVALATAALLAFFRRRDGWAGVLLGLGAAAKFYPAMLVVPLIAQRFRDREPDRGDPPGLDDRGHLARGEPAVRDRLAVGAGSSSSGSTRPGSQTSTASGTSRAGGSICVSRSARSTSSRRCCSSGRSSRYGRSRPGATRASRAGRLGLPLVVLFLLTNKVYSPQYGLWLLPWFALALPDLRAFVAFSVADVAVFVTRFSWFGEMQGLGGASQGPFEVAVLVRTLVLLWCLVAWIRREPEPIVIELPAPAEASRCRARADRGAAPDASRPCMSEDTGIRLRDGVRTCMLVFLGVRVGLSLLSVIGVHLIDPFTPVDVPGWPTPAGDPGWHNAWDATVRLDALWFLRIASEGYVSRDGSAAFFPLYPLAIRVVAWLPGVSPVAAALIVSNASFLGALIVLYGLTRLEFAARASRPRAPHRPVPRALPDRVLLPGALQRVAVPAAVGDGVLERAARSVGVGRRAGAARRAHPEHRRGRGHRAAGRGAAPAA